MAHLDWLLAFPTPTQDSPTALTPLSIMQPGAMLRARGLSVKYFDQRHDPPEMFDDLVKEAKNVGVSCFTGKQAAFASDLLERAKKLNPKVRTHVGGHHARLCPDDVRAEPHVDVVWSDRWYGEDLFPWDAEDQRLWKRGEVQYQTSRGCSYGCGFCALRSPWVPVPVKRIEHELGAIAELRGELDFISLTDPNAGQGFGRNEEGNFRIDRLQRMKEVGAIFRGLGIEWDGNIRSDYITPEYRDAIVDSGCSSLEFGAESGDDWFLRRVIRKGHGVDAIRTANLLFQGSGVSVMNSFIRGMPRETHAQWLKTMDLIDWLAKECPDSRVSVYRFSPYPGGPAYDDAVAGVDGFQKFNPPKTMKGWGNLDLMVDATYWIAGLNFRLDNSRKNFPGEDWKLIEPYIQLAREKWRSRAVDEFPVEEVSALIAGQVQKLNRGIGEAV